jgi:fluoride ion exporter CrcB/FEX
MLVGAAGFAFSVASLAARFGWTFPLGTLLVNVVGSFALGALDGKRRSAGERPVLRLKQSPCERYRSSSSSSVICTGIWYFSSSQRPRSTILQRSEQNGNGPIG